MLKIILGWVLWPNLFLFLNLCSFQSTAEQVLAVRVDKNQTSFSVTLPANPTTGFQWTVKQYDKQLLKLQTSHYIAPHTKRMGAGGDMTFIFSRLPDKLHSKSTTILFRYARSWEPVTSGTLKQIKIYFK